MEITIQTLLSSTNDSQKAVGDTSAINISAANTSGNNESFLLDAGGNILKLKGWLRLCHSYHIDFY
jgi:hypothetical protein